MNSSKSSRSHYFSLHHSNPHAPPHANINRSTEPIWIRNSNTCSKIHHLSSFLIEKTKKLLIIRGEHKALGYRVHRTQTILTPFHSFHLQRIVYIQQWPHAAFPNFKNSTSATANTAAPPTPCANISPVRPKHLI